MDTIRDLPVGFGMALAQNIDAMQRFCSMPEVQQCEIIARAGRVRSGAEMASLVESLSR